MAINVATHAADAMAVQRGEMTPRRALRLAWLLWLTMLALPFVLFMAVLWRLMFQPDQGRPSLAMPFFFTSMAWLALALTTAIWMRNRYFKEYWNGKVVAPADYLKGMACMWIATEIGGIIALVGCFMANDLVPNILPAAAAFGLFVPFWPSGHAMTRPVGLVDDNEVYEDPR